MGRQVWAELLRWLIAASWVYFTFLGAWSLAYFLTGDRYSYLALIHNLAVFFFFPLPLIAVLAGITRRKDLGIGVSVGVAVFMLLWGPLFLPRLATPNPEGPALKVMTYNVLGRHMETGPIRATLQAVGADVVFIQELNHALADILVSEMHESYPYQVLDPVDDVTGMGVISKYPLQVTGDELPLTWVGKPQILALRWEGETITLINFHMYPSGLGSPDGVAYVYRAREEQARVLADYATHAASRGPVLAAGDANVIHLSDAYRLLSADLQDAWWEAGFGLGHTFPGSAIRGSSRPRVANQPVPRWLARIDYIFYSTHWDALAAHLAPFDGVSDHRGVVARLALKLAP